ncbi:hypothetical protein QWZ10_24480 [Paracoccus cavernae]|uniref:Uncharacterized protein n=2 Tax=Paracoccus cavernae TaxID=1571207 RepID=A0ABT8DGV0_9RHOB|nr:hypothetical protein [Paracoccus cavernae]
MIFMTTTECPRWRGGEQVWLHARPSALHVFDTNRNRLSAADEALARADAGVAAVREA